MTDSLATTCRRAIDLLHATARASASIPGADWLSSAGGTVIVSCEIGVPVLVVHLAPGVREPVDCGRIVFGGKGKHDKSI